MEVKAVNNIAATLGLLSQEDADLCTKVGKSLQYRIDAYKEQVSMTEQEGKDKVASRHKMLWSD